ncbi:hypothetical protein Q7P35_005919 [Cladosporium inversicolor]
MPPRPTIPAKRPVAEAQEAAWVADEDRFVLQQAKKKAAIRAKSGRAQPIDWLAVTLALVDPEGNPLDDELEDGDVDLLDPESVFEGLDQEQLTELEKGIDTYIMLEGSRSNRDYWNMMKTICQDRQKHFQSAQLSARGVTSVAGNIDKLLAPKTLAELQKLEGQIRTKLSSNEPIDTDYWEHLLQSLLIYKARANLRNVTQSILASRLGGLRKQQAAEADAWISRLQARLRVGLQASEKSSTVAGVDVANQSPDDRHSLDPEPLLRLRTEDKALDSLTQNDFSQNLVADRRKVLKLGYVPGQKRGSESGSLEPSSKRQRTGEPQNTKTSAIFDREVARGLSDNEELLTTEIPVETKNKHTWPADARPRKPQYFNRCILGYEWNKYNQTHYDHDNPPPKVVQGYKFNVLYPDLLDKTRAPTYKIEREGGRRRGEVTAKAGEDDTCIIRFVAGAPYEDIAFKIVDREWDYSAKRERGFRSSFDKGILQLHFQFKKHTIAVHNVDCLACRVTPTNMSRMGSKTVCIIDSITIRNPTYVKPKPAPAKLSAVTVYK